MSTFAFANIRIRIGECDKSTFVTLLVCTVHLRQMSALMSTETKY